MEMECLEGESHGQLVAVVVLIEGSLVAAGIATTLAKLKWVRQHWQSYNTDSIQSIQYHGGEEAMVTFLI